MLRATNMLKHIYVTFYELFSIQIFVPYIYPIKRAASFEAGWPASKPAGGCESGLNIYERSTHQTTVPLSKIYSFIVRTACSYIIKSASYGSKHRS